MKPIIDRTGCEYRIRAVQDGEEAEILEVYRQCEDFLALGPQPHASLGMVLADLEHSREDGGFYNGIYVVQPDGKEAMVGVVDYIPGGFEGDPRVAFLSLLMIAAPYRNRGLGEAVSFWVEDQVRQEPAIIHIQSGVQINNPQAIRFWKRRGYRIAGEAQVFADGTTAYPLEKSLA